MSNLSLEPDLPRGNDITPRRVAVPDRLAPEHADDRDARERDDGAQPSLRAPILWGFGFGAAQAASPLAIAWLEPATVQAVLLAVIAAIYVGFAVADGRPRVIATESVVAVAFVLLALASVTGTAWLLIVGYAGHGLKDYWQGRHQFVANTRWWPPFCATIDLVIAVVLLVQVLAGVNLHS